MNHHIILLLCFSLLILSCGSEEANPNNPNSADDYKVETIIPTGEEKYLNTDSDYIFDQEKLPTFELNLPASDYEKINSDPAAEEYVEGSITFEGETISPVGIRYKGSLGAFVGCLSGLDWSNPSGHKTCPKLSMKIKINWNDADAKFYGLKKLQFHSMNNDPTQMRERLGYWLFRQMGVPAPRAVHARLFINGNFSGVYALVEQIDGRFTRENFEDGKGNLYKEIWPLTDDGQPHADFQYLAALKTNEDENPSPEIIRDFAQQVANAGPSEIEDVTLEGMDVEKTLAYAVVDRTIRNDDGAFHWYCDNFSNCSPHNFYWYEEPTENKVYLIPWDLDHAFENIITDVNPVVPIADDWGEISGDCEGFSYGAFGFRQRSAVCDKLVAGWVRFGAEYDALKSEFVTGPFSAESVSPTLQKWEDQIRSSMIDARVEHDDAISIDQWELALSTMKARIQHAREN